MFGSCLFPLLPGKMWRCFASVPLTFHVHMNQQIQTGTRRAQWGSWGGAHCCPLYDNQGLDALRVREHFICEMKGLEVGEWLWGWDKVEDKIAPSYIRPESRGYGKVAIPTFPCFKFRIQPVVLVALWILFLVNTWDQVGLQCLWLELSGEKNNPLNLGFIKRSGKEAWSLKTIGGGEGISQVFPCSVVSNTLSFLNEQNEHKRKQSPNEWAID